MPSFSLVGCYRAWVGNWGCRDKNAVEAKEAVEAVEATKAPEVAECFVRELTTNLSGRL